MKNITAARRVKRLRESPIRKILSINCRPNLLSFAGGLPAAETFPNVDVLKACTAREWQYGPSEGEFYLREYVAQTLCEQGWQVGAEQVLILSGSQQGIDLTAKLMVEAGSLIAVESPTYLAALQVFDLFGASYMPFTVQDLEEQLMHQTPSLVYTIPTFQNPSANVYTRQQRQHVAELCDSKGLLLFEDDRTESYVTSPVIAPLLVLI